MAEKKGRKKVLIVTYPKGGPWTWAKSLAAELGRKGYDTEVVSGRKNYLLAMFRRPDILHSCISLPVSRAGKYVLTIKGDYLRENLRGRLLFPLAIRRADRVTVPSAYLKKALGLDKAVVIANGVTIPEIHKTDYRLASTAPTLGLLTNFDFRPKARGLLALAAIVREAAPQAGLVIGGYGRYFEEYRDRTRKIFPAAEFLGRCRKEDLFPRLDIFTYYSKLDNQPNAILEAMAAGLPVISNEVGAVKEIMMDKAAGYIARNDEDYRDILKRLLASEEARRACGEAARNIARQFAWDKLIDQYIGIYEN